MQDLEKATRRLRSGRVVGSSQEAGRDMDAEPTATKNRRVTRGDRGNAADALTTAATPAPAIPARLVRFAAAAPSAGLQTPAPYEASALKTSPTAAATTPPVAGPPDAAAKYPSPAATAEETPPSVASAPEDEEESPPPQRQSLRAAKRPRLIILPKQQLLLGSRACAAGAGHTAARSLSLPTVAADDVSVIGTPPQAAGRHGRRPASGRSLPPTTTAPPPSSVAATDAAQAAVLLVADACPPRCTDDTSSSAVLRCVADLELAVAHLRARDPRLVPLIDAHGLPHSLLAAGGSPAAGGAGGADAYAAPTAAAGPTAAAAPDSDLGTCAVGGGAVAVSATAGAAAETEGALAVGDGSGSGKRASSSVFAALARSVVYQQLATNAATAIWGRVLSVCQAPSGDHLTPHHVMDAPPEQLRGAGLSGRKLEYLTGLAEAFAGRDGWDEQLSAASDLSYLVSELTPLRGIGTWTVHMLAMFHLGLPDVLPSGDLGVRRGLQLLHHLSQPPAPEQVEALTDLWKPYRSVGSWYMWRIPPPPRGGGAKKVAKAKVVDEAKEVAKTEEVAKAKKVANAKKAFNANKAAAVHNSSDGGSSSSDANADGDAGEVRVRAGSRRSKG